MWWSDSLKITVKCINKIVGIILIRSYRYAR